MDMNNTELSSKLKDLAWTRAQNGDGQFALVLSNLLMADEISNFRRELCLGSVASGPGAIELLSKALMDGLASVSSSIDRIAEAGAPE
jgi:hypothetical protein